MRYIPLNEILKEVFSDASNKPDQKRLQGAHRTVTKKAAKDRKAYIDNNGISKWTPIKNHLTGKLGNKCWYTEAELVGAPLTIDHYRPKCNYWFLAFRLDNFRVACPYANSPKYNEEQGCSGGKGDEFPLLNPGRMARGVRSVKHERPVILDPCNKDDCKLVVFDDTGRPKIAPDFANDPIAKRRVEMSMALLNLDLGDFNSKREQLRGEIEDAVADHEAFTADSPRRQPKRDWLAEKISKRAPFSKAARQYLSAYRYLDWVEDILDQDPI